MTNQFDQFDASPEITEITDGEAIHSQRTVRVGPDLQARMGDQYEEAEIPRINTNDVVDGDRERVEMLTRDEYDDDFERINREIADCDERLASTIDPETGRPHPHLEDDYRRYLNRRAGLNFSLENQTQIANVGRQSRLDEFEANVQSDAQRVSEMQKALAGLSIRDQGKDVL